MRSIPLFAPTGHPTTFLMRQWTQKGALQPLRLHVYLDRDGTGLPAFRSLWQVAFPSRAPLPSVPLADKAGRGTDAFWSVFA